MTTIPAEKLDKLVARWEAIQGELASGADAESYAQLSKEYSDLDPIVGTINALRQAQTEREGLQEILGDS
ncbi:MAG: peptide chain release factor 1, partial [Methyloceanibacter sp.]